jgi:hypothetical protein
MSEEPDFTMGDLLQELRETFGEGKGKRDETGLYSCKELADFYDVTRRRMRKELNRLKKEGRLDDTQRKLIPGLGLTHASVPAYRLIEKREDKENDRKD